MGNAYNISEISYLTPVLPYNNIVQKITKAEINKTATHPVQTWEWGEFIKEWGNEVVRLPFGQITLHRIPKTKYKIGLFAKGVKPTKSMLKQLKDLSKKENLIFIKLEPNLPARILSLKGDQNDELIINNQQSIIKLLKESGAIRGKPHFTPSTFWLDLTKTEDELMKSFHNKTRYNIRYAARKGVNVVEDNSDKAFEKYLELTRETVARQGFYAHTERYHRLMWQHLHHTPSITHHPPIARLLTARYKKEIISAWVLFVWKDFLYYPYGASTHKHKNLMANNLMMWEAIRYGKSLGLRTFDFWGREIGKGYAKFKEGYSPQIVEFVGSWDLVTSRLYWPYRAVDLLRWSLLKTRAKFSKPTF